jgi:NitT/TauT family transport system permease protein
VTRGRRLHPALSGVLGILVLVLLWEGYKLIGPEKGWLVGKTRVLPRASDLAMPHVSTMISRLFEPTVGASTPPLWQTVLKAAIKSLGIAGVGWAVGTIIGLTLAMLMQRFVTARSAILPWVVLSQTVPLIAIAPLVRRWGAQLHLGSLQWHDWMSVSFIASYLAFFPVAIGALRGLASPAAAHTDLMRSLRARVTGQVLRSLRLPRRRAATCCPALRLGAASAVLGAVVAEVSIGLRGGIGRMIIQYGQASLQPTPPRRGRPTFGSIALIGLVAASVVALLGLGVARTIATRGERQHEHHSSTQAATADLAVRGLRRREGLRRPRTGDVVALDGRRARLSRRASSSPSSDRRGAASRRCCASSPISTTPTSGQISIFGKTARQARLDQDYGIAFQQAGLLPWRTVVGQHRASALSSHKVDSGEARAPVIA